MGEPVALPVVPLPTMAERHVALGPFASVADAARFGGYAAAGALVIPFAGMLAWLPLVALGFLFTASRPGGIALDRGLHDRLRYWGREFHPEGTAMTPRLAGGAPGIARVGSGCLVAIVKCEGHPLAFLPPEDLLARFRQYRELLRSLNGGFAVLGVGVPIDARPWMPKGTGQAGEDRPALGDYGALVEEVLRCHQRRRIYLLLWNPEVDAGAARRLEERLEGLMDRLRGMGIEPTRLVRSSLAATLGRFGWGTA